MSQHDPVPSITHELVMKLPLSLENVELPLEYSDFYLKYADPENKIILEETRYDTDVTYDNILKCALIGQNKNERMIIIRSTDPLEPDDMQSVLHRVVVYEPQTGTESHYHAFEPYREPVPRGFHGAGHIPEPASVVLHATDTLNPENTGAVFFSDTHTYWVEDGALYPLRNIKR